LVPDAVPDVAPKTAARTANDSALLGVGGRGGCGVTTSGSTRGTSTHPTGAGRANSGETLYARVIVTPSAANGAVTLSGTSRSVIIPLISVTGEIT